MFKKLNSKDTLLLIIDVQEKLVKMLEKDIIVAKTSIIAATANILEIPTVVTEQYPQGLGSTVKIIKSKLSYDAAYFEKTSFSALEKTEISETLKNSGKKQIIICGIESHVCVLQSAIDLINEGYEVFIVKDACASRNKYEFKLSIDRLKEAGAIITCVEMVIFELLGSAKHPKFKELQALIK